MRSTALQSSRCHAKPSSPLCACVSTSGLSYADISVARSACRGWALVAAAPPRHPSSPPSAGAPPGACPCCAPPGCAPPRSLSWRPAATRAAHTRTPHYGCCCTRPCGWCCTPPATCHSGRRSPPACSHAGRALIRAAAHGNGPTLTCMGTCTTGQQRSDEAACMRRRHAMLSSRLHDRRASGSLRTHWTTAQPRCRRRTACRCGRRSLCRQRSCVGCAAPSVAATSAPARRVHAHATSLAAGNKPRQGLMFSRLEGLWDH